MYIREERTGSGIAILRIDRAPINALSAEALTELGDLVRALAIDADLRAVVLTGTGRSFAAGAEITHVLDPERGPWMRRMFREVLDGLAEIPRPVIAAVNGFALGGGCELALACDLRIAAASARLGVTEITLGLPPGAGATQRLPRLIGASAAKDLIWSGRHLDAARALEIGLVDRVVPDAELARRALTWAEGFARGPVVAMGLAKHAIIEGAALELSEGLDLETRLFDQALETEDAAIGVASFLAHGPGQARFLGR